MGLAVIGEDGDGPHRHRDRLDDGRDESAGKRRRVHAPIVRQVVQAILEDDGYAVSCLYELADDALLRAVGRLEPDVVVLDSASAIEYGGSWDLASTIANRRRPVPVVIFTAHSADATEAGEGTTARAEAAHFAAVVLKPFHMDELLAAVATAAGRSTPFDRSEAATLAAPTSSWPLCWPAAPPMSDRRECASGRCSAMARAGCY